MDKPAGVSVHNEPGLALHAAALTVRVPEKPGPVTIASPLPVTLATLFSADTASIEILSSKRKTAGEQ
jgi:hypothetical protein